MHINRMDPEVEQFVPGGPFTHYAVTFYTPKWADDATTGQNVMTVEPNSDLDVKQVDDMTRFCNMVNGTMFRWSGQMRGRMAGNLNHRFYPVGAAWSKFMLIVGFNM